MGVRVGEIVEVRLPQEILSTLDEQGKLQGLPFMPEMLQYCGRRFRVLKSAHKTCDTIVRDGQRSLDKGVLLDLRCDGSAHGRCEAACLIFWKEDWLKRVDSMETSTDVLSKCAQQIPEAEQKLMRFASYQTESGVRYSCQATELRGATKPLPWWDLSQYLHDVWSKNIPAWKVFWAAGVSMYNALQRKRKGAEYPFMEGKLTKTPKETLDLQPGDWVQVKDKWDILATVDTQHKNRGLSFDREMIRYCGKQFRVLARVKNIVDEKNGKMLTLPGDCIILEGVTCVGDLNRFCPRNIYPYWREIWLTRVPKPPAFVSIAPAETAEVTSPQR